jgi:hypothetical protein
LYKMNLKIFLLFAFLCCLTISASGKSVKAVKTVGKVTTTTTVVPIDFDFETETSSEEEITTRATTKSRARFVGKSILAKSGRNGAKKDSEEDEIEPVIYRAGRKPVAIPV